MRLPDAATAGKVLMVLLALLIVMHILLLLRVIPYDLVWGGNIEEASLLVVYETSALVITGIFLLVVALKLGYLEVPRLRRAANISMWVVFAYFAMNIISNLTSGVTWEKVIFIPISIVLALLSLRVATQE